MGYPIPNCGELIMVVRSSGEIDAIPETNPKNQCVVQQYVSVEIATTDPFLLHDIFRVDPVPNLYLPARTQCIEILKEILYKIPSKSVSSSLCLFDRDVLFVLPEDCVRYALCHDHLT